MFFHERKDMLLDYSPNVTEDMYITNMHPFFTTIVFGLFAKLGVNVFGNIDIGVGIYTFIQMVLYAGVFSYTLCYFEKLGMNNKLKTGLLVFSFDMSVISSIQYLYAEGYHVCSDLYHTNAYDV